MSGSIKAPLIRMAAPVVDALLCPFLLFFSLAARLFRFLGSHRLPASRGLLRTLGVIDNESFLSGDADYLYSFVRRFKPRKTIEVGCGNSTRLAHAAIATR
jgi:hypothetical protein